LLSLQTTGQQLAAMMKFTGRTATSQFAANPYGIAGHAFQRDRWDGVHFDTANTMSFFQDKYVVGSSTVAFSGDFTNVGLVFTTGSTANNLVGVKHSTRSKFPLYTHPGFTVKFRLAATLASRRDWWGFTNSGGDPAANDIGAMIGRDTALGTSLRFYFLDSAGSPQVMDTLFSPAVDTIYYMSLIVVSLAPGSVVIRIGTTYDWKSTDTFFTSSSLDGTGDIQVDDPSPPYEWRFTSGVKTLNAAAKTSHLMMTELFSMRDGA
jgi:hypothetical protein